MTRFSVNPTETAAFALRYCIIIETVDCLFVESEPEPNPEPVPSLDKWYCQIYETDKIVEINCQ